MNAVQIGPSVVCMDPLHLFHDIQRARDIGIDYLHFDVMDGVQVERYGLYPEIGQELRDIGIELPIDVHLMVRDTRSAIRKFPFADSIGFHVAIPGNKFHFADIVRRIQDAGQEPMPVFNLCEFSPWVINQAKLLGVKRFMLMGCLPGVTRGKINGATEMLCASAGNIRSCYGEGDLTIQVDGGVTWDSVRPLLHAGINSLVCGSATIYNSPSGLKRPNTTEFYANMKRVRDLCTSL